MKLIYYLYQYFEEYIDQHTFDLRSAIVHTQLEKSFEVAIIIEPVESKSTEFTAALQPTSVPRGSIFAAIEINTQY